MMIKINHRMTVKKLMVLTVGVVVLAMLLFRQVEGDSAVVGGASQYSGRLFDNKKVHTIDLQVENWPDFIQSASKEEYVSCTVVIDGEKFSQVGLRAKGNNSLRQVEKYELCRYSLKLEFDHYRKKGNYYGLDKFSLDAAFQDNSYMKNFLVYDMMTHMGVPAPLCSYVWVTVNGYPWGVFMAVEEPEEAFAKRCFGEQYGQLYKPDYRSLKAENADVDLRYVDENPESYENIFRKAKFDVTPEDKARLIQSLKILGTGEQLETVVNVDEVLRYFAVQVFVLNMDSYLGSTGHNYFLYEEKGKLSMLPWDYNLAFGTYCYGMSEPIRDVNVIINYPIDTPWEGGVMQKRPLFHNLMKNNEYFAEYHKYLEQLLVEYFENGHYRQVLQEVGIMIAPYVEMDPTAFCEYEEHLLAVDTLMEICELRAKSIRGQLSGKYPSTFKEQSEYSVQGISASHVNIRNLGDFDDLRKAKDKQNKALMLCE